MPNEKKKFCLPLITLFKKYVLDQNSFFLSVKIKL